MQKDMKIGTLCKIYLFTYNFVTNNTINLLQIVTDCNGFLSQFLK